MTNETNWTERDWEEKKERYFFLAGFWKGFRHSLQIGSANIDSEKTLEEVEDEVYQEWKSHPEWEKSK